MKFNDQDLKTVDLLNNEYGNDIWPIYKVFRERDPVCYRPEKRSLYIFKYNTVKEILQDERFRSDYPFRASKAMFGVTMLDAEGELHQKLRQFMVPLFKADTTDRIRKEIVPLKIQEIVTQVKGTDIIDLRSQVAEKLPIRVAGQIIGMDSNKSDSCFELLKPMMAYVDSPTASLEAGLKNRALLEELLSQWLETEKFRSSLFYELLSENFSKLQSNELIGSLVLLLAAGSATTSSTLCNVFSVLLKPEFEADFEQFQIETVKGLVYETLRMEPPLHWSARFTDSPVEFMGLKLPPGTAVHVGLASANRDEEIFENSDSWDFKRKRKPLLSFGWGIHYCMGLNLAQAEMEMLLLELVKNFKFRSVDSGGPIMTGRTFRSADHLKVSVESRV